MPFISQNFLAGDTRLQLGAEEITRPLAFGSHWTKIRIGMRIAFLGGTSFTGGAFSGGVCLGSKGFSAVDCTDAVGAWMGTAANPYTQTWTYLANYGITTNTNPGITGFRKVGPAITSTATGGSYISFCAYTITNTNYSAHYWDITRASATTATVSVWNPGNTTYSNINVTLANHMTNMESENTVVAVASNYAQNFATGIVTTNAAWDNIFISWSRLIPVIEIRDLSVIRFY